MAGTLPGGLDGARLLGEAEPFSIMTALDPTGAWNRGRREAWPHLAV